VRWSRKGVGDEKRGLGDGEGKSRKEKELKLSL